MLPALFRGYFGNAASELVQIPHPPRYREDVMGNGGGGEDPPARGGKVVRLPGPQPPDNATADSDQVAVDASTPDVLDLRAEERDAAAEARDRAAETQQGAVM